MFGRGQTHLIFLFTGHIIHFSNILLISLCPCFELTTAVAALSVIKAFQMKDAQMKCNQCSIIFLWGGGEVHFRSMSTLPQIYRFHYWINIWFDFSWEIRAKISDHHLCASLCYRRGNRHPQRCFVNSEWNLAGNMALVLQLITKGRGGEIFN